MSLRKFSVLFTLLTVAVAQAQPEKTGNSLSYYDAEELVVEKGSGNIRASGKAIFMLGTAFISADKIEYLHEKQLALAEGNVRLIRSNEEIRASRLAMDLRTNEIRLTDALFVSQPGLQSQPIVNREILNFTTAEIAFEASRKKREAEMMAELRNLREQYIALRNIQSVKRSKAKDDDAKLNEIKLKYSRLLERLARTRLQPNLILNSMPEGTRKRLLERREAIAAVLASNPNFANDVAGVGSVPGYLKISADVMFQNKEGNIELENVSLTPCKCGEDGLPAYGFTARTGEIEPNKYATLTGTTVDFLNVPVAYTPYLKIPIKTRRETGLLLPSFYASRSGEVFSQPLFVTLGDHADATVTANNFSDRGLRGDLELRYQITNESKALLYFEGIRDGKHRKEGQAAREEQLQKVKGFEAERDSGAITNSQYEIRRKEALDSVGPVKTGRWYLRGASSVPANTQSSIKTDVELVSDNRYFGDFTRDESVKEDLFSPKLSAKRFLTQEGSAEYYSDNYVLGVRVQKLHDLFAYTSGETPMRTPRAEFHLLPKRYFGLPIVFDEVLTWEYVKRPDGVKFKDKTHSVVLPTHDNRSADNYTGIGYNGRRDADEPYFEAARTYSQTTATLPLPANKFVNASVGMRGTSIQYNFPAAAPMPKTNPYATYVTYDAALNVPIYSLLKVHDGKGGEFGTLRHNFTPRVRYEKVPEVKREKNFPTLSLYHEDETLLHEDLHFGFSSSWILSKDSYAEKAIDLPRVPSGSDVGVANQDVFRSVLEENRLSFESPEKVFEFSSSESAPKVFQAWANKELAIYESQIRASEFGDIMTWPSQRSYARKTSWKMTPFSLDVGTKYKFAWKESNEEYNARVPSGEPKKNETAWDPIYIYASFSASPFFGFDASLYSKFNFERDRQDVLGLQALIDPGYGFSVNLTRSYEWIDPKGSLKLTQKDGYDFRYQPPRFSWLQFNYQRLVTMVENARYGDPQYEYDAIQRVSFLGIQDCMDIIIQRRKYRKERERDARLELGINISLLNQSRELPQLSRTYPQLYRYTTDKALE